MVRSRRLDLPLAALLAVMLSVPLVGPVAAPAVAAPGDTSLAIRPIATYDNGGEANAEIVAHDPDSQRLFVVNAEGAILILDATDLSFIDEVDVSADGEPNSVAVRPGTGSGDALVAVALADGSNPGAVGFYDIDMNQLSIVTVGDLASGTDSSLPDMVTFNDDGTVLLVANEGEYDPGDQDVAADDTDPEGSITLIDTSAADPADIDAADVTNLDFQDFNSGEPNDLSGAVGDESSGLHLDPTAASIAQDLEPEYIAVQGDTAFVTLQEANAVAVVDIVGASIDDILPLGFRDHSVNGLDGSDDDGGINIDTYDGLYGIPMPDTIAAFEDGGTTYFVTANEGDARALDVEGVPYDSDAAERSVADTMDDAGFDGLDPALATDAQIGPLLTTPHLGDTDSNGDHEELYAFGSRSFSIHDAAGNLVFDSGDDFEQVIADRFPEAFNSDDPIEDDGGVPDSDFDNRSDNKGPEPEGLAVGEIGGVLHAFVGLERMGGIMLYDISDPANAEFVDYLTARNLEDYRFGFDPGNPIDYETTGGDVSPEGITYVAAADSPTGRAGLAVAHEISGTVTFWDLEAELTEPAAAPTPDASLPTYSVDLERRFGPDRVATAVDIARDTYPSGTDVAVIARKDEYADALVGVPLAAAWDAPILLTDRDMLRQEVATVLRELGVETAYLLGGEGALSGGVADAVEALDIDVTRIGGATRFDTAALIADRLAPDGADTVFVVEGINADPARGWPDAMSVGPYAALLGAPIVPVRRDAVPSGAQAILDAAAPQELVVIGGPAAVSDDVLDGLDDGERTLRRLSGVDRFATNGTVYDESVAAGLDPSVRWLATGLRFPDALTSGAAAGVRREPLVLGRGNDLGRHQDTMDRLTAMRDVLHTVKIVGGGAAISQASEDALADALAVPTPAPAELCLTVLHNNDGESQLIDAGSGLADFGGAARFATRLLTERARGLMPRPGCEETGVLTVTSGDNFLAGSELNASRENGFPLYDSRLYDYLDYDAIDLGNHDFDFGPTFTADFVAGFTDDTPFLSANLETSREPALAAQVNLDRIKPSTTVQIGSHTVGVIGLTTPTLPQISSPGGVGVFGGDGAGGEDLAALASHVDEQVAAVEAAGADIIVLISHLQGVDTDLALVGELSGVDVVVAGGGDEILANPGEALVAGDTQDVYGTYPLAASDEDGNTVDVVTTAGSYKYVGRYQGRFDASGALVGHDVDSRMVRVAGGDLFDAVAADTWVQANVVDPVAAYVDGLATDVIATTQVPLDGTRANIRTQETNEGNLVADAYRWQAMQSAADFGLDTGAEFVGIVNGGGIRNDTVLPAGDLTTLDTFDISPFGNFVSAFEGVTAAQLDTLLEHAYSEIENVDGRFAQVSNLVVDVDRTAAAGSRVSSITLGGGAPIPAGGVTLVVPNFLAGGGDGYPFDGSFGGYTTLGRTDQQALAAYLSNPAGLGGTVTGADYPPVADDASNATRILY